MSQESVEIARAVYETWNAGDMHAFRDLYDPDVVMRPPEGWPEPGPFVGRDAVMREWAKAVATKDRAKGPFVVICQKPGYTIVVADEETVNRGFGRTAEGAVQKIFDSALKEAAKKEGDERTKHRDAALLKATDYVISEMKGTKVRP